MKKNGKKVFAKKGAYIELWTDGLFIEQRNNSRTFFPKFRKRKWLIYILCVII